MLSWPRMKKCFFTKVSDRERMEGGRGGAVGGGEGARVNVHPRSPP